MSDSSSEIAGVSLFRAGIRVSWRVLMSKARLSTAPGTASILMLILPNSVKSAPHLVEYAWSLGRMLPSEKFGYSSCKSFPICAVENFLKPRSLNTLAKQSWFVSSLFSCMTLLLGDEFLGEHPSHGVCWCRF